MNKNERISIGALNVTGIVNLREIVDDINQSIDQIQNAGNMQIAEILKEIGQAVVTDARLEKQARRVVIQTLQTLAHEAGLPPAERQLGVVRLALRYISMLLITNLDILHYFQAHLRDLKKFFGIP